MRFEWLVLRWLAIISLLTLGLGYAWSFRPKPDDTYYQKVLVLDGTNTFGSPLAGIAIAPERHEVYGLLRGSKGKDQPPDFFILWRGNDGQSYGVTFVGENSGIYQISPDGQLRQLHDFRAAPSETAGGPTAEAGKNPEEALRAVLAALPPDSDLPGKR